MSQTVSEMFGYERESDDDKIIDNYDDSSSLVRKGLKCKNKDMISNIYYQYNHP